MRNRREEDQRYIHDRMISLVKSNWYDITGQFPVEDISRLGKSYPFFGDSILMCLKEDAMYRNGLYIVDCSDNSKRDGHVSIIPSIKSPEGWDRIYIIHPIYTPLDGVLDNAEQAIAKAVTMIHSVPAP